METNNILFGDCRRVLTQFPNNLVDLVYLDPPFYTQKKYSQLARNKSQKFEFDDYFDSLDEYLLFLKQALMECRRVLKDSGCIFLHCDRTAAHHIRLVLEAVFGTENFQSEIIWHYKRWSNSKKGLLNSHQLIYFFFQDRSIQVQYVVRKLFAYYQS